MLKKIEDMDYYELLEVSHRASAQEIHKAYERVRKIYDPNSIALYSLFSPEETEKIRQRVEDAYRTLIYDENRREYDRTLREYEGLAAPEQAPPVASPAPLPNAGLREPPMPREAPVTRPITPAPAAPTAPAIQAVPANIKEFTGPVLKMMREQRSLSVQNVADITKLSTRYITGIEEESFEKLPARPYLRGFLYSYSRSIGYEPEQIVISYMKRYDAAKNPPTK